MTKREKTKRIKDRYFRKVIGHPRGAIGHFGDCSIYQCGICNCGLLSDLTAHGMEKLYPAYWKEWGRDADNRSQMFEIESGILKTVDGPKKPKPYKVKKGRKQKFSSLSPNQQRFVEALGLRKEYA